MRWNDCIELISIVIEADRMKNQTKRKSFRKVYANVRFLLFSAKVAAGIDDYSKIKVFEIMSTEYSGEEMLRYRKIEYEIIDVTMKGDRTILTAKRSSDNDKSSRR